MGKSHSRWLDVFIAGTLFMSFLALKSTFQYGRLSLIIPLTMILMMPIGEWCDRRFRLYKKVTTFFTVAFTLYLPLMSQNSGVIATVVNLFLFVQLYSMIHIKTVSTYYHILLMSFFLLIATLVMSPSAALGMVLFGYIVTTYGSLLLLDRMNHSSTSLWVKSKSWDTTDDSVSAKLRIRSTTPHLVGLFFVVVLGLTAIFFILIPRTEAGFLGTSVNTSVYTTGLSKEVELDITGSLKSDSTAVMRVQFIDTPDGKYANEMYWRSTTMDKYTGSKWLRQGLSTKPGRSFDSWHAFQNARSPLRNFEWAKSRKIGSDNVIRYEIFMDTFQEGGFPLLSPITYISSSNPAKVKELYMYYNQGGDFTVNMNYRSEIDPYFIGSSKLLNYKPSELRASSVEYLDTMRPSDYRLLTEHNLEQRTQDLSQEITQPADTNYDRVILIKQYLSSTQYRYTRDIPPLNPEHPIDDFIHDVHAGHCELYASAMALMVRSQGIPTRVVSGYRGGTWDENNKSYTVTNNMAHLWVEVYFPDLGWITFDPTPGTSDVTLSLVERFQNAWAKYSLQARVIWLKYIVGFSPNEPISFMRDQAFRIVGTLFSFETGEDGGKRSVTFFERAQAGIIFIFVISAIALTMVFVYRLLFRVSATTRAALSPEQIQAKRLYTQLLVRLKSMGLHDGNLTADEVLVRLESLSENIYRELCPFVKRYHDARFGSKHLTSDELLHYRNLIKDLGKSSPI